MDFNFEEQYKKGFPVFEQLFNMKAAELKDKLKTICGSRIHNDFLFSTNSTVKKVISNDVPQEITVSFYDRIDISPYGINYKPEHRNSERIVEFNDHFKL